jgi:hypothetical protein
VERETETFAAVSSSAQAQFDILKQHHAEMQALLGESREAVKTVHGHFVEAARYVTDSLKD